MEIDKIKSEIDARLAARQTQLLNRNAMSALFGAFSDPVGALGMIFLGRSNAIDAEKQLIAQELALELLCKIDDAISRAASEGINLSGLIETNAQDVELAIGVHIVPGSGPVVFSPGTHIRTNFTNVQQGVGLKIGGGTEE